MSEFNSVLKDEIDSFLMFRKSYVKSAFTYKHDFCIMSHFDNYLCRIGCDNIDVTEDEIYGWMETIDGKSSTKASYVTVVRCFLKQLIGLGYHPFMPKPYKVNDDYIAYQYSDEEIARIIAEADKISFKSKKYPYFSVEFPVILRLLYSCGLRLEEVTHLKVSDVDFDNGILFIKKAKRGRQRYVPMHESMTEILYRYCIRLDIATHNEFYVFPGTDLANGLPSFNVRNQFNKLKKSIGMEELDREPFERGACLHCFRHKFAFDSFKQAEKNGGDPLDHIPWLSIYLGHSSLDETQKYLKFSFDMYPEAMDLFEIYSETIFPEVNI